MHEILSGGSAPLSCVLLFFLSGKPFCHLFIVRFFYSWQIRAAVLTFSHAVDQKKAVMVRSNRFVVLASAQQRCGQEITEDIRKMEKLLSSSVSLVS